MLVDPSQLPSLLYLGDVAVEASYHGSALLYRLLQHYPRERLLIVEPTPWRSQARRRLEGARYEAFPIGWGRLLNSRFARIYGSWVLQRSPARARRLREQLRDFKPTAVLTVTHGYTWLSSAEYARSQNLPLHLILHDDWLTSVVASKLVRAGAEKVFARYYAYATSRLCVSPGMAERYQNLYGTPGAVLYPMRAPDAPVAREAIQPKSRSSFTVAFAGTINGEGYIRRLQLMAEALRELGGTLLLYGPTTREQASRIGLDAPNIELRGLLQSSELIVRLRDEADLLFVPMSFRPEDRINMELSFPSKLTDYTATGLPLLINGPDYCSAVRWATENQCAEVVTDEGTKSLVDRLTTLRTSLEKRFDLGDRAMASGDRSFSYKVLSQQFLAALATQ